MDRFKKPYSGSAFVTGDLEDILRLKKRHPSLSLSTIAKVIQSHGPGTRAIEGELLRQAHEYGQAAE